MVKLCCGGLHETEDPLGVLLEELWDAYEELVLVDHVVRNQCTRASWSTRDQRRVVRQLGDYTSEEIVGNREAAIRTTYDDDVISICSGVFCHLSSSHGLS